MAEMTSNPKLSTVLGTTASFSSSADSPASPASPAPSQSMGTGQQEGGKLVSLATFSKRGAGQSLQRIANGNVEQAQNHNNSGGDGPRGQQEEEEELHDGEIDDQEPETALDIEFEQAWDNVGDSYSVNGSLDETDLRAMDQENIKCFG